MIYLKSCRINALKCKITKVLSVSALGSGMIHRVVGCCVLLIVVFIDD